MYYLLRRVFIIIVFKYFLGVQQNRLMTSLYKDERSSNLLGYSLLKDMYLERLIKSSQVCKNLFFLIIF